MKKVTYTDPFTFNTSILEVDDFLHELTVGINAYLIKRYENKLVTESMVSPDGDAFSMGVCTGGEKYKIQIELFKPIEY